MALFRLKKGTAAFGTGRERRIYNHADPQRNVAESDQNLVALDPEKWERVGDRWEDDEPRPRANQTSAPQAAPATPAAAPRQGPPTARELEERYGGPLDDMTVAELREIAEAEGVEVPKSPPASHADVLKALKAGPGAHGKKPK